MTTELTSFDSIPPTTQREKHDAFEWLRTQAEHEHYAYVALREWAELKAKAELGFSGWAIRHSDEKRWRTMDSLGMPDWTEDPEKALVCKLKEHIELYAQDDPEDVRIVAVTWKR